MIVEIGNRSGNDDYDGRDGSDVLITGKDDDTVGGGEGDDVLDGGPGQDLECLGANDPDVAPADSDRIRNCE